MTEIEDLGEEVARLKQRVSFLEKEIGESLEEKEFERGVERWFDDDVSVNNSHGRMYAEGKLNPDHMKEVVRRLEQREDMAYNIFNEDGEAMLWVESRNRKI